MGLEHAGIAGKDAAYGVIYRSQEASKMAAQAVVDTS